MTIAILTILGSLVPLLVWWVRRAAAKHDDPAEQHENKRETIAKLRLLLASFTYLRVFALFRGSNHGLSGELGASLPWKCIRWVSVAKPTLFAWCLTLR